MALQAGKVAPDGGGEQIARQLVARDALQDGLSLALGRSLRSFQGGLGGIHAALQGVELPLADALDAQTQRRLLSGNELVLGFVPLTCAVSREAADGDGFAASSHAVALGPDLAIDQYLRFQADAGGDGSGQLTGVGEVGRDERFNGLLVCLAGCDPGQGQFLAGQAGGGGGEAQDRAVAPGGAALVGVDAVLEFGAQVVGDFAELPCSGLVCLGALLGGVDQGVGVQRHGSGQVHALLEGVLLEAAVHGHPAVGNALAGHVPGPAPGLVLDEGFDPGVLNAHGANLAARDEGHTGHAALPQHLLGGVDGLGAADPVHHLFGRDFDAAVDVARRDAAGSEQGNEQAGGVNRVAGFLVEGVLRTLDAALRGLVVDVVVYPLVDLVRVLAQVIRQLADGGGVGGVQRRDQVASGRSGGVFGGQACTWVLSCAEATITREQFCATTPSGATRINLNQ